ncbi:diguanylate cyclase domain-containing protein [Zobellella sp. DQSA1]|uniref:diguanylate cyclase domain-containing protein n=1 Tax=Zobellella sp. DQSA1 TaxID=3342386 RepID=UPI0035BFC797
MSPRPTLWRIVRRANLKVTLIAVGIAALSLAPAILLALRGYTEHNLEQIGRAIGYTTEAAVVFEDSVTAQHYLQLIALDEDIGRARIRLADGRLFAEWQRPAQSSRVDLERRLALWLLPEGVEVPIEHAGRQLALVELDAHGGALLAFLLDSLLALLAGLLLSAVGAYLLSWRMLGNIVAPLQRLAGLAYAVRKRRDFSHRLPDDDIAELHSLNQNFNALLDELQLWQQRQDDERAELEYQATHDGLTGLANRGLFERRLRQAVEQAHRRNNEFVLLYLDCNKFKQINDTYGHAAGDLVLMTVAERLRERVKRQHDVVARLGGDEFAILLSPPTDRQGAEQLIRDLHQTMSSPVPLPEGKAIHSSLSIGMALYPGQGRDADTLMQQADLAMYRVKQARYVAGRGGPGIAGRPSLSPTEVSAVRCGEKPGIKR